MGKLKEVPGVFNQGESLEELEENIRDAYSIMLEEETSMAHPAHSGVKTKDITVDVV